MGWATGVTTALKIVQWPTTYIASPKQLYGYSSFNGSSKSKSFPASMIKNT